jgi:ABC-type transport system involved in cytochrome bd biosynthesis fused ATPase/permease subunit
MHYALFIVGILTGMLGLLGWLFARTALHEVLAAVLLLICAVLICGAAIVRAIERLRKQSTKP